MPGKFEKVAKSRLESEIFKKQKLSLLTKHKIDIRFIINSFCNTFKLLFLCLRVNDAKLLLYISIDSLMELKD